MKVADLIRLLKSLPEEYYEETVAFVCAGVRVVPRVMCVIPGSDDGLVPPRVELGDAAVTLPPAPPPQERVCNVELYETEERRPPAPGEQPAE